MGSCYADGGVVIRWEGPVLFTGAKETFFLSKAPGSCLLHATSGLPPRQPHAKSSPTSPSICLPPHPIPGPRAHSRIRFSPSPTPLFGPLPQSRCSEEARGSQVQGAFLCPFLPLRTCPFPHQPVTERESIPRSTPARTLT